MIRNLSKVEYSILGVVITVACMVVFNDFLLTSVLVVDVAGDSQYRHNLVKSNSSEAEWLSKGHTQWRCNLLDGHQYPVCGHEIYLNNDFTNGIDLSRYESFKIWLKYKGQGNTVRLFLRTYNPVYSNTENRSSTKYHSIEFQKNTLQEESLQINLEDVRVAEWWLLKNNISLENSYVDLSNVVIFEIQTGSESRGGPHDFQLDRIEFHRRLFSTEAWYLSIIIFLLGVGVCFLIYSVMGLKQELSSKDTKNKKLQELYSIVEQRRKEMEVKSKTDPLTGVSNREGAEVFLKTALDSWETKGEFFSITFIDVDHFKSINDSYGHAVGDDVLVSLSALVSENIRADDWFARWGGEEFVLICQKVDANGASNIAEKIRKLIEGHIFHEKLRITASFGIATISLNESLAELFIRADEALYKAKRTGRNRVISAG